MKKRVTLLLAAVMLLLSACRQVPSTGTSQSAAPSGQTDGEGQANTPVQAGVSGQPDSIEPAEPFDPSAVMEEMVLVDERDVKITATELKYTAYDVKLNLAIENNSGQNLSFYSGTLGYNCNSINGYMVDDGYLNVDIAAGKKPTRPSVSV